MMPYGVFLSLAGVPYFPRGNVIFSIVLTTNFLCIVYPAFARRMYGYSLTQGVVLGVGLAVFAQLCIFGSTVVSYVAGLETYFNHPEALNAQAAVPFAQAVAARAFGVVVNGLIGGILALIGYALGGLLPQRTTT